MIRHNPIQVDDPARTIALCCYLAQSHVQDRPSWSDDAISSMMQCPSYQVACILAHNTELGEGGVDWDVVHEELCGETKSYELWLEIAWNLIQDFDGIREFD